MNEPFWVPEKQISQRDRAMMSDGIQEYQEQKHEQEPGVLPATLTATPDFIERYGHDHLDEVYWWYHDAMLRRGRDPLDRDRFLYHFFDGGSSEATYGYGEREDGYLMGVAKYGVFVPTHFAPRTLRSGYELISRLGDDGETPALMVITPDLVDTITKLPSWKFADLSFLSQFRDDSVTKEVVYNSHPNVERLALGLLSEYLGKSGLDKNTLQEEISS